MKIVRWVLFGAVLALYVVFAVNNWVPVPVTLPNGATVMTPLPMIVFGAFLLGWLPLLLLHVASRATWRRRIGKVERALDEATRPVVVAPAGPATLGDPVRFTPVA